MRNKLNALMIAGAGLMAPVLAFAEDPTPATMATQVTGTATALAGAAAGVVTAGLVIFGVRWGVKKIKAILGASA